MENILDDIKEMKANVESELDLRGRDHDIEKEKLEKKYQEKLKLYKTEIERLNIELQELENTIEEKFNSLIVNQTDSFNILFNEYLKNFNVLKTEIEESIEVLVKRNVEHDDAVDSIKLDYDHMIQKLKEDTANEIETMQKMIEDKKHEKIKILNEENNLRSLFDAKVAESDDIIKKNVQIKVNIIDTTQRSITLQEQLIETEKNLVKIDEKMNHLVNQNSHLEQIRFVLEHRMNALEKEKPYLEEQCHNLEHQKYSLQNEFNKLVLQINKKNQVLENKQSQLKANLIQNFEVDDHINYMKKKLNHLNNEVYNFIKNFHDDNIGNMSIQEKKATNVVLCLRNFYEKYFPVPIEDELENYGFYSKKLQEECDKVNIANNGDLKIRDKGEEKNLNENLKMDQITLQKEKGFKRMQNENTILIGECNRLRKNLHEVYMHVVDIEKKFEDLTKINPSLNKAEIVNQIKLFIKKTRNVVKSNYEEHHNNNNLADNFKHSIDNYLMIDHSNMFLMNGKRLNMTQEILNDEQNNKNYQENILSNLRDGQENMIDQRNDLEALNVNIFFF
jgi:hypothetical protein